MKDNCLYDWYERGYWDAVQFSYMKDMTQAELLAWTMGLHDGRTKGEALKDIWEFEFETVHGHNGLIKQLGYGTVDDLYLDWFNNFLSVQGFADHHDIGPDVADSLITNARNCYRAKWG